MSSVELIHSEFSKRITRALEYRDLALKFLESQDLSKALEYFNFAIAFNPTNSDIYCDRAECFYSLKDNKFFIRDLTYAITTNNGKDIKYWEKRADGYIRIGERKLAEQDKEIILKLIREQAEWNSAQKENTTPPIIEVQKASLESLIKEVKTEKLKESDSEKQSQDTSLKAFTNLNKVDRMILNLKGASYSDILKVYAEDYSDIRDVKLINLEKILKKEPLYIDNSELLTVYVHKYGKINFAKVNESLRRIEKLIEGKELEIYDWGAGTSFSATVFFDFIKERELDARVNKLTLIDAENLTLTRQKAQLKALNTGCPIATINKNFNEINKDDFSPSDNTLKLHLFTNILDHDDIDIKQLVKIFESFSGANLFICVSSFNINSSKLDLFYKLNSEKFGGRLILNNENTNQKNKWKSAKCPSAKCPEHSKDSFTCKNSPWTRKEIIFTTIIE